MKSALYFTLLKLVVRCEMMDKSSSLVIVDFNEVLWLFA
jgi:hypothetical protein